jgi:penicillin-binding protein 2
MNHEKISGDTFDYWRIRIMIGIFMAVFVFFAFRLFNMQILNNEIYVDASEENRTSKISVQTQRGVIYDRNGFVLARNVPSYNVVITPANLPGDEGAVQEIYRQLSDLIDIPVTNGEINDESVRLFKECDTDMGITEIVYIGDTNAPYKAVKIKCGVDEKTAMIIQEKSNDWLGVGIEVEPVRDYPTGELTAEVIGFLGPIPAALEEDYRAQGFVPGRDKVGYAGVESSLQDILGGKNGERVVEVDVAGQVLRDLQPPVDPVPGNNVKLTIDTRLQSAAKEALKSEINFWNTYFNEIRSTQGAVIAINPKTGEILAFVSFPTFENNRMARFIPAYYYNQLSVDPARPLFNHAISAELPPGSVYKLAAAVGALNEGVVKADQKLECPSVGKITITQKFSPNDPGTPREYVCWQETGHGMQDYPHAISNSCDVYFYKISGGFQNEVPEGLGIWRLAEYARALGYGNTTGIELPGEADGLVPDPTWKRLNMGENWATGDTYIASMGQGYVLSTVIQVLVSFAIVANDGKYIQPTLVREVLDAEGNVIEPFTPKLKWDITKDPLITVYDENNFPTEEKIVIDPFVVQKTKEGMRLTVTAGTGERPFAGMEIPSAGKTGTAEFCDDVAQAKGLCQPGSWPSHSWYVGYAPFDDPEIAVVAFVYNGREGASVSAPIVRRVMEAYFELKAIDSSVGTGG